MGTDADSQLPSTRPTITMPYAMQTNDATSANIHPIESLHMDSHAMTDLPKANDDVQEYTGTCLGRMCRANQTAESMNNELLLSLPEASLT
jgi:hypothetical protein